MAEVVVGIDIVDRRRRVIATPEDRIALERTALSPAEQAWVHADPSGERHLACLAVKESLVKALGGWPAGAINWRAVGIDPKGAIAGWSSDALAALGVGLATMVGAARLEHVACSLDDAEDAAAVVAYGDLVVAAAAVVRPRP